MQDFKKLIVWQKSQVLMADIYKTLESFPKEEIFSLTRQIKESVRSVGANLAEGSCKSGDHEFKRYVGIALGSACELENHLLAAQELKFLPGPAFDRLYPMCQEIRRMLVSLLRRLAASKKRPYGPRPTLPPRS
ncbi:MAG TPA: four helix bundle protein [Planctomycetota bacterium]|nr:four helix bundle protein [Planctomycetota bacterium]